MMSHSRSIRRAASCGVILISLHCTAPSGEAQDDAIREALKSRVEALRKTGRLDVRGSRIASVIVLPRLLRAEHPDGTVQHTKGDERGP